MRIMKSKLARNQRPKRLMDREETVETMEICKLKGMNINNCIITKLVRSVANAAFLENYQHDKFDKIIFTLF